MIALVVDGGYWLQWIGAAAGVVAAIFAGLTLFFYFWHRRLRIDYRIRDDLEDRVHPMKLPMLISITNSTGGTIFRENAFIELPDGTQIVPNAIEHHPPAEGHHRQIRPGDTIVITYDIAWLSDQLLKQGYSGKAKVKFVFADAAKRHVRWMRIKPSLEHWARPTR